MATISGNVYTGSPVEDFLRKNYLSNPYFTEGLGHVHTGDKDSFNVADFTSSPTSTKFAVDPFASFATDSSSVEVVNIKLTKLQMKDTFTPSTYHSFWKEYQPSGNFQFETLPAKVQVAMMESFVGNVAQKDADVLTNDDGTILSENGAGALQGGLVAQAEAQVDGAWGARFRNTNQAGVDATAVALDASNILGELKKIVSARPVVERNRADQAIMMNDAMLDIFNDALEALSFKGIDPTDSAKNTYRGMTIKINSHLADNVIFCGPLGSSLQDAMIHMGTNEFSDNANIEIAKFANGSARWYVLATYALAIYLAKPGYGVYYNGN